MVMKTRTAPCLALLVAVLGWCGCAPPDRTGSVRSSPAPGGLSRGPVSPGGLTLDLGGGATLELVRIPAGEFTMGSPESEEGRYKNEGPQHVVRIEKPFFMGRYEVTEAQWTAVMGENPSRYRGDDLPAHWIAQSDATEFCRRLTERVGRPVRLPTEAEWEYACRAGSTTAYPFGDGSDDLSQYAWYDGHSRRSPNPVGGKEPNAWGLYDMLGNVWEWCADSYRPGYADGSADGSPSEPDGGPDIRRVLRGGSWFDGAPMLRSACRIGRTIAMRSIYIGFRVVVEGAP